MGKVMFIFICRHILLLIEEICCGNCEVYCLTARAENGMESFVCIKYIFYPFCQAAEVESVVESLNLKKENHFPLETLFILALICSFALSSEAFLCVTGNVWGPWPFLPERLFPRGACCLLRCGTQAGDREEFFVRSASQVHWHKVQEVGSELWMNINSTAIHPNGVCAAPWWRTMRRFLWRMQTAIRWCCTWKRKKTRTWLKLVDNY